MEAEFEFMKEIIKGWSIMRKDRETITAISFGEQKGRKEDRVLKINCNLPLF